MDRYALPAMPDEKDKYQILFSDIDNIIHIE